MYASRTIRGRARGVRGLGDVVGTSHFDWDTGVVRPDPEPSPFLFTLAVNPAHIAADVGARVRAAAAAADTSAAHSDASYTHSSSDSSDLNPPRDLPPPPESDRPTGPEADRCDCYVAATRDALVALGRHVPAMDAAFFATCMTDPAAFQAQMDERGVPYESCKPWYARRVTMYVGGGALLLGLAAAVWRARR